MGRQTRKTKQAIYDAFSKLLTQKSFSKITMQEIAELADVGRSTVYSHFETKEAVLSSMCADIFEEMFTTEHIAGASHDELLIALLTHIKCNKKIIMSIFLGEGTEIFTTFCRQYFYQIIETSLLAEYNEDSSGISKDFLINHMIGSFMEMIRWWAKNKMVQTPEQMAQYYMQVTLPVINSLYCL